MEQDFILTKEQINFFSKYGYLHIPNAITKEEVDELNHVLAHLINRTGNYNRRWEEDYKYGDLVGEKVGTGNNLCRIEYSLEKSKSFIKLLGHPRIVGAAVSLHEVPLLVTWEDIIVKLGLSGTAVPFHQDLLYQSTHSTVFSIGVYFNESTTNPLIVLPGSQELGPLSESQCLKVAEQRKHEFVMVPVKAGDLLIHNVLMIHGSMPNNSTQDRSTLYFEFRTIDQVLHDSPWDQQWMDDRLKYIPKAIEMRFKSSEEKSGLDELLPYRSLWDFGNNYKVKQEINWKVPHPIKD